MHTYKASEFKAKCLKLMDDVAKTGEAIIITKNGNPVAQLVALPNKPHTLLGALKGFVSINGDIVAPTDAEWDALK
jgi:prevent-host-death family protein